MNELIKSSLKNPLITIKIKKDPDFAMVFCATEDEKGNMNGISLWAMRQSKGPNPYRLRSDLVPRLFKPVLTCKTEKEWKLHIQPSQDEITILKKPTHYVCLYPFKDVKKSGQLIEIVVDGTLPPNPKMWFTVTGSYKASKESKPETLQVTQDCPSEFTDELTKMFQ